MAVITAAIAGVVGAVAAIGSAYSQKKAAGVQKKMANVQNARERKLALRDMRIRQRAIEGSAVSSGTVGSSAEATAMASASSNTASGIGHQGSLLAGANQISHWNNMTSGFGTLASVATSVGQNASSFQAAFNKIKGT